MIAVSVIIPVYNDFKAIKLTLSALEKQTFSRDQFEIIVIDNGSTDGTWEWLSQQKNILLLRETTYLKSPYSARNRGIERARGKIIALLDATCVPTFDWLEKGVAFFEHNFFDFFGGNVIFDFEKKITAAKIYDSMIHIQMETSIKERNIAKTANLWVKKYVFDKVGLFIDGIRSGEDIAWTCRCTHQEYRLGYCADCLVHKFARNTKELLKKQFRTGKGAPHALQAQGIFRQKLQHPFKKLLPPNLNDLRETLPQNLPIEYTPILLTKIYFIAYLARLVSFGGNIYGLLFIFLKSHHFPKMKRIKNFFFNR